MARPSKLTRKNFRLPQAKIDEARRITGSATETETIERALDLVLFSDRLRVGVEKMRGARLQDVFGEG